MKRLNVIDLFCGCGGLSLGLEKAGFNTLLGIDNDNSSLQTFQNTHKNVKTLLHDLSNVDIDTVSKQLSNTNIDVVVGGPPCQGFSIFGKRRFLFAVGYVI